jgi:hypothetical protein
MYNMIKKIEYCIIKMVYNELDTYIDDQYNITFIKEHDYFLVELGIKINYELQLSELFNYKRIDKHTYKIQLDMNIDKIINEDNEELFVNRYKKYLQPFEKVLLYLSIDNDNNYIYDEYKLLLKNTIQSLT